MVTKENEIDIELKLVDFSERLSESFTKINPAQTIPTLVDGDVTVCDSQAICLYLIEKYAKDDYLYPKNDLKLRTVINDRLFFHASFLFIRGLNIFGPVFFQGQTDVPQEKIDQIHRGYRVLENYLSKTKWVASNERITVADLAIFAWVEPVSQLFTIEKYPKIQTWLSKMRMLPYYEEANKKGADMFLKGYRDAMNKNKL